MFPRVVSRKMSANLLRPTTERLTIAGPAGDLEALLETPANADGARVAVICHPHPVYGGTMTNKVVHVLAMTFNERGVPAVGFNFRGVGASAGAFDEGAGETQDGLAVMEWALQRFRGAALWVAGFSFGGAIAVLCSYEGYHADAGAEGVGKSTASAVVITSVAILVLDALTATILANKLQG